MRAPGFDAAELEAFLSSFGAGRLRDWRALEAPGEERRYVVRAGDTRYVVTVYDAATPDEVTAAAVLSETLAERGVPCPRPIRGASGSVESLGGRPAVLAPLLGGRVLSSPGPAHLAALGTALGRLHLAGEGLPLSEKGAHLSRVLCPLARELARRLRTRDPGCAELLDSEAEFQQDVPEEELPSGLVHGALLSRNLLFGKGPSPRVAFLGFERSGRGPWVFDLALVLADGAWSGPGISGERARAFLAGYRDVRGLGGAEFGVLPAYLRRVALRFLCLQTEARLSRKEEDRGEGGGGTRAEGFALKLKLLRAGLRGAAAFAARAA
ncbi:MAG: phosphotransferase [Deltaproteobacteria bacterium]|nr:phosphotransferase [Deltaproteobacteria bacterium]